MPADLDHLNEDLRKSLVDWLNFLKDDIGYDCWRFDFVKGYGAEFMHDYVGKTVGQEEFNVGEYWADLRQVPAPSALDSQPKPATASFLPRTWCIYIDPAPSACRLGV